MIQTISPLVPQNRREQFEVAVAFDYMVFADWASCFVDDFCYAIPGLLEFVRLVRRGNRDHLVVDVSWDWKVSEGAVQNVVVPKYEVYWEISAPGFQVHKVFPLRVDWDNSGYYLSQAFDHKVFGNLDDFSVVLGHKFQAHFLRNHLDNRDGFGLAAFDDRWAFEVPVKDFAVSVPPLVVHREY